MEGRRRSFRPCLPGVFRGDSDLTLLIMKLAFFADLHLDAPFAWARPEVARRRRQGLRDCLRRILEVADGEKVDAILCAGDLYEHDYVSPDTREFLRSTLGSTNTPILIAPGNHDWYGPSSLYRQVSWPSNVHVFSESRFVRHELAPGIMLWGVAFTGPTRPQSFLAGFRADGGGVRLALFHGSEMSSAPPGKNPHAPFSAGEIETCGFLHAFVGHYHQPADHLRYTYPGNPDPLSFGETGERGLVIAEIGAEGPPRRRRLSVVQSAVHDIEVDLSECGHFQEVRDLVASRLGGLKGVVRLFLRGDLAPDVALDLQSLAQISEEIEQIVFRTEELRAGYDFDALAKEPTVRGRFVAKVLRDTELDAETTRRILVTGLRALDGRSDLEAF